MSPVLAPVPGAPGHLAAPSGPVREPSTGNRRNLAVAPRAQRAAWAIAAAALVGVAVVMDGWGWWLLVPALAPDLPLFFGAGSGLSRGQLHPRAVPAYNLTHRMWGPAAPITVGLGLAIAGHGRGVLVVGLVWGAHVAFDRACGYGLRTPAGFQR